MFASIELKLISVSILLLFSLNFIETSDENKVSVRLKSGEVLGKIETTIDGKTLSVFRGIPYAQPPVGALRFRRPVPVNSWDQPIEAFEFGSSCVQNTTHFDLHKSLINKHLSEDCLYLNIWSPIDSNEALKPVMVWIHGGGLWAGAASEVYYQADILVAKGDVVVVSLNYRLATLGFFYSGTEEAPGNVGLWDQTMALEWINDNIKYFGGDPNRITIFGESAGGWSTSLHIISPVSRHLFANAIALSGAYLFKYKDDKPEDHMKKWLKGAALIGCSDDQNPNQFTEEVMECLRAADPLKLTYITDMSELLPYSFKFMDLVVTDGLFLPKNPIEMLRTGDFKQNVKLMISTVGNEGGMLLSNFHDAIKYNTESPKQFTRTEAYEELQRISSKINIEIPINGHEVAELYFTGLPDNDDYNLFLHTMSMAFGDLYITCPAILFAKEVFRNSGFKTDVYQVFFNSKFNDNNYCSKWMGVCHANDNAFVFGMPFFHPEHYNDRERQISAQMIQYMSHFAKNGAPNPQDGAQWEKYYQIDGNIIAPYYEIRNTPNNITNFGLGFKINECEYLWQKYII